MEGICQNMQRPISHSDRELEIHTADQIHIHIIHTSWAPLGTIFDTTGSRTYRYWCRITKPLSCTLPWVYVRARVCVKQTRQFRLKWWAHSNPALAPRGYPRVPLSRCGKAECWMGYPIAPAWLLGSRLLNQSQIGLWTACYEYVFLRLHRRENTSSRQHARGMHYDCCYDVDVTFTQAPTKHAHCFFNVQSVFPYYFVCPGLFLLLIFSLSLFPSTSITLSSFALSLFPFLLSPQVKDSVSKCWSSSEIYCNQCSAGHKIHACEIWYMCTSTPVCIQTAFCSTSSPK